ncbi:MAG: hypothetical protein OEY29_12405 [Gammaproteobacteria bacterium]|nr:hypothetical protein [Gammaproteobacteria bacterium]
MNTKAGEMFEDAALNFFRPEGLVLDKGVEIEVSVDNIKNNILFI